MKFVLALCLAAVTTATIAAEEQWFPVKMIGTAMIALDFGNITKDTIDGKPVLKTRMVIKSDKVMVSTAAVTQETCKKGFGTVIVGKPGEWKHEAIRFGDGEIFTDIGMAICRAV